MERKNINRGFKQLRVWNNAIDLYLLTCKALSKFPLELMKPASNCMDAAQSISRNIAEGYSRKSIKQYLVFLNYALGSSGEFHSCMISFLKAGQISQAEFEEIDKLHFQTENQLIQLVKSLQRKLKENNWETEFK